MPSVAGSPATGPPGTDQTHPQNLWSLLSTEIKVIILQYASIGADWTDPEPSLYEEFHLTHRDGLRITKFEPAASALWVPGMREIATEIFLRTKRCYIDASGYQDDEIVLLPPLHISRFLRGVDLDLRFQPQDWNFLCNLSTGVLGFENLDRVEIVFRARPAEESIDVAELEAFASEIEDGPISFPVKYLRIKYDMWVGSPTTVYYTRLQHFEHIRFLLFNQLSITPKNDRPMAYQCEIEEDDYTTCVTRTMRMWF